MKLMKVDQVIRRLIEVARANPPSDRVPLAFEKRVMSRLREIRSADSWGIWESVFWKSVPAFLGITLVVGAVTFSSQGVWDGDSLQDDLESALYAEVDNSGDHW